ncbi:MAG: S24 family peptidase [Candidatus Enterenecus sp.]
MNRIKQLRQFLGYTQAKLAQLLHVSRSAVAMWETAGQDPDYETLKKLSQIFNAPPDFVMGRGIFEKWDLIVKYYDSVSSEIMFSIPGTLELPFFCGEKNVRAWLDTRLYYEPDELQLARWFDFAIQDITITPDGFNPGGRPQAKVSFCFTEEFAALIAAEERREAMRKAPTRVPVLGDVAAGIPIEAITDIVDYEEIDAAMAASGEFFGLRIKGASMEPRMREGDVVIVRRQDSAETGDTVVVLVNGDNATVKKIKYGPDGISLIPTNPSYDVQFYSAADVERLPVRVIGRVVELRAKY